jgi:hypothetical protein
MPELEGFHIFYETLQIGPKISIKSFVAPSYSGSKSYKK